jgi:hypothetical protein
MLHIFTVSLVEEREKKWCNYGHGWGKTQEEAWKLTYSDYEDLMLYNA